MKAIIIVCAIAAAAQAQGLNSRSALSQSQSETERQARAVQPVIDRAEQHYKRGELSLKDRNYDAARGEFDKAVDAVLESGIDVRSNPRLQTYYLQLLERIFRMEFPARVPRTGPRDSTPPAQTQPGFLRDQKFDPSPLDDLARLELGAGRDEVKGASSNGDASCQTAQLKDVRLRGFRLGMTAVEVRQRLPKLHVKAGRYGLETAMAFFVGRGEPPPAGLRGVVAVSFVFIDGKAARIIVGYDDSIKWNSLEEFGERTSEALQLPNAWREASKGGRGLFCGDLSLVTSFANSAANHKSPMVTLEDGAALTSFVRRAKAADELRRRAEERKKQTFKP